MIAMLDLVAQPHNLIPYYKNNNISEDGDDDDDNDHHVTLEKICSNTVYVVQHVTQFLIDFIHNIC
jgi:hypothetical protein